MNRNKKLVFPVSRRNKTLNNEILTKTEVALQAIRSYEVRNDRIKNRNRLQNPIEIMNKLDEEYTRLHFSKEMSVDKIQRIQLFPYNQAYFSIDLSMMMFPIRVFVKNVRNQGILYVGYDRQFPGVSGNHASNKSTPRRKNIDTEDQKNYDYKFKFNRDVMYVLKKESKKHVSKIYLNFSAQSQLVMFNTKFDCIGYEGMDEVENRKKRVMTEQKILIQDSKRQTFFLPPTHQKPNKDKNSPSTMRATSKTRLNTNVRSSLEKDILVRSNTQKIPQITQRLTFYKNMGYDEDKNKDFLHLNLLNLSKYRRQNSKEAKQMKKQKMNQTILRIQSNKDQVKEYKQKERQIKDTATKFKKLISEYQKAYKGNLVRNRKIIHLVAPMLFATIFQKKGCILYEKQAKKLSSAFVVRYFIKKFTSKLEKKYKQHVAIVPRLKDRTNLGNFHFLQMESKFMNEKSVMQAASIIWGNFSQIKPGILINLALNKGSDYRRSARIVQRRWKTKYDARMEMLEMFAEAHISKMLKQFPHLKLGLQNFRSGKHRTKICYEYMVDESIKYRSIYQSYLKRNEEIAEYIKENNRIKQINAGKPQRKWKKYLQVPKQPTAPQHRIFRNLDILKSMLRGWFQLQYKKYLKKNASTY